MFEAALAGKLKRIFDIDKVTYDTPSESMEQEALFIEIKKAKTRVVDGLEIVEAIGVIRIFAQVEKLPYGYMAKCLSEADVADTAGLFFSNFEQNKGTLRNITERSAEFIYLSDGQYDPNIGTLNEVNLSIAETL